MSGVSCLVVDINLRIVGMSWGVQYSNRDCLGWEGGGGRCRVRGGETNGGTFHHNLPAFSFFYIKLYYILHTPRGLQSPTLSSPQYSITTLYISNI